MTEAVPEVQVDNDRVRVTKWSFARGAATGWHRHEYDYVVVPMTNGTLQIESAAGTQMATLVAGQSYSRLAGVEHDVINPGPNEVVFVEVEIKAHGLSE